LTGIDLPSGVWPAEVAIWMTASISSFEGWGGGLGDLGLGKVVGWRKRPVRRTACKEKKHTNVGGSITDR